EAHRRDRKDHDAAEQIQVEGLIRKRGGDRHEQQHQEPTQQGQRAHARAHQARTAGNRPCGRKERTAAMRREMSIETSAGPALSGAEGPSTVLSIGCRNARPSVSTIPTMTAPTSAPRIDPMPPITMTTKTWIRISSPIPGSTV